ncbi:MAG: carboxypeptidase regulatory-like domain-containing protein [Myxococcota bacterium]
MSLRRVRNILGFIGGLSIGLSSLGAYGAEPSVRDAAQKGVVFLAKSTAQWQRQNNCYGCHVQAVTLEGLSVGKANQYEVPSKELQEIVEGILRLPGGARTGPQGITHSGYPRTARTFGSAALARYDALVDGRLSDDLLKQARLMLELQQKDGSVTGDHQSYPVTTGTLQATFQAAQTWRQAYARSADDVWLPPLRKAEAYIVRTTKVWENNPKGVYLQDVNYALLGLVAAGVGKSEGTVTGLVKYLTAQQRKDGGWGFHQQSESNPFATGQTVYALRQAGLTETDPTVANGLRWLVKHQQPNGGWGAAGAGKAEAMWAVLGLVSTDVLTVAMKGVSDGEHVAKVHEIVIEADDNKGSGVAKTELFIDDLEVKEAKGGKLSFTWNTAGLKDGLHTLDAVATNHKGQTSRRRFEVYAGDVFFTQLGTQFTPEGTQVTLRGVAPKDTQGELKLRVLGAGMKDGSPVPDKVVYEASAPAAMGAVAFTVKVPNGRYFAQVAFVDEKGATRQTEQTLFNHDNPEKARAQFAEVAGKLELSPGGPVSQAAVVELLDNRGRVVQSVRSNEAGNYRFKNVDKGDYKVRVRKEGFRNLETEVKTEAGKVAPASMAW